MELTPVRIGSAMALTVVVVSLVCMAAAYLSLEAVADFVNAWVCGFDLPMIMSEHPRMPGNLTWGLFGVTLTAILDRGVFAVSYNLMRRCCERPSS